MGFSPNYIVMVVLGSCADISREATGLQEIWGGNNVTGVMDVTQTISPYIHKSDSLYTKIDHHMLLSIVLHIVVYLYLKM